MTVAMDVSGHAFFEQKKTPPVMAGQMQIAKGVNQFNKAAILSIPLRMRKGLSVSFLLCAYSDCDNR